MAGKSDSGHSSRSQPTGRISIEVLKTPARCPMIWQTILRAPLTHGIVGAGDDDAHERQPFKPVVVNKGKVLTLQGCAADCAQNFVTDGGPEAMAVAMAGVLSAPPAQIDSSRPSAGGL